MLIEALGTARDIGRLHEIGSILIRHGLGDVVQRTGIAKVLQKAGKALHWDAPQRLGRLTSPQRVRMACEELGPTFVKLGQVLAGRTDLLDPEWTGELSRLQQNVRKVPFDELREQLVQDLGRPPEDVFLDLETEPLAAASIAQVHRARLPDGTPIVLKVRRPGIAEVVRADLRLLARLAELLEEEMPEVRRYQPRMVVRQFARSIRDELDLVVEARNADAITRNMAEQPGLVIPRTFAEWSSKRLLVQEYLDGISAAEWVQVSSGRSVIDDGQVDGERIAGFGADAIMKMVFVDGLYHADPHPGNVLFLSGDRIGLLDFGMVGRLSTTRRIEFTTLLAAAVDRNEERAVEVLLGWSGGADCNLDILTQDVTAFIDRYHGVSLDKLDVNQMLGDIAEIVRENALVLPSDVALLLRAFVTLDGLGRALAPGFQLSEHVAPFARTAVETHYAPQAAVRRGLRDLAAVLGGLPRDLRMLLSRARHGNLKMDLDLQRLDAFGHQIDRSANRLTVGMVTSALIIGTSVALTVSGGPRLFGMPFFALLGFVSSLVFGLWLLWSISRASRS
jgi:ubiquinone biosynthesis protein